MSQLGFQVRMVDQGWLLPDVENDFRSVGRLTLTIDGQEIVSSDEQYGIAETALALLRTIDRDFHPDPGHRLVLHGCGLVVMSGCPIGAVWRVQHSGESVHISDVALYPTTNDEMAVRFEGLRVMVPSDEYARDVVSFARAARTMFVENVDYPDIYFSTEDGEWAPWSSFIDEFDHLLARHADI
jgi:hypothetical protein